MANLKHLKRSLFSSIIALLISFTMLLGTTFAWFTDTVTSSNNIIQTGDLKIGMYWAEGAEDPADEDLTWKDASQGPIFNYAKWEPGYAEAKHVKIVNEGTLSLKYKLVIVPNGTVSDLANVIDVYFIKGGAQVTRAALAQMIPDMTLADLIADPNGAVRGALLPEGETATAGTAEAVGSETVTIVLKMQENAGNDYKNKSIGMNFSVQLLATQYTKESDSIDNWYDQDASYPGEVVTAAELIEALNSNKDIVLARDIDLANVAWTPIASYSGTLNGNGYAIKNLTGENGLFTEINGATITDLTLENVNITGTGDRVGAIAGSISKDAEAPQTVIDGVVVTGTVTGGGHYTGGFVGADRSYDTLFVDCVNEADVTGPEQVGGIIGQANRKTVLENCVNSGDVTATNIIAGGIVGLIAGDDKGGNTDLRVTVQGCSNTGAVTEQNESFGDLMGGIAGAVGRDGGDPIVSMITAYILDCTVAEGQNVYGAEFNYADGDREKLITVVVGSEVADGVYEEGTRNYWVGDAEGLVNVYSKVIPVNAERSQTINLMGDIDLSGLIWEPVSNMHHTLNGYGFTISNVTCKEGWRSGFYAYAGNVTINDLTLENVTASGSQAGTFAGAGEGFYTNNCFLKGENSVTYFATEETHGGIGAITGVITTSIVDLEIVSGATVTLYKNGMITECTYYDDLTGYLNANNGTVTNNGEVVSVVSVSNTAELIAAIKTAPASGTQTIYLKEGDYSGAIDITVDNIGTANKADLTFTAASGEKPVIAGTVTLGYYERQVGNAMFKSNIVFEKITFDHAEDGNHCLNIQSVSSVALNNCTIIGDGENGINSTSGNDTGASKITGCTFENAGMQILGNFGTNLLIENCIFNNSRINVQAGNLVTVQGCTFNSTLTEANIGDSFYAIRSNDNKIVINNCTINVDSELTEVAGAAEDQEWAILWQRKTGNTKWEVNGLEVNLTEAAEKQTLLLFNFNETATEANKATRISVTNLTSTENEVSDLIGRSSGYLIVDGVSYLNGKAVTTE